MAARLESKLAYASNRHRQIERVSCLRSYTAMYVALCGPRRFSGKRYFVTFIADKSRYCVVYQIKNKSEVIDKFSNFVAFAEKQTGKRVKPLRCDNGGEYAVVEETVQEATPPASCWRGNGSTIRE